jgi:hypothetical protein
MIVTRQGGDLRLVTQRDHAHFAAELLSVWRAPELLKHPRRRELLEAVREHDNGWQEADAAPRLKPSTREPYGFLDLPLEDRLEVWRRGVRRFAETAPYLALLISQHALALFASRSGEEPFDQLLEELERLREDFLARCALGLAEAATDYRWLELADALSLAACGADLPAPNLHGWKAEPREGELSIAPFPLAGATTFQVPCRTIPARHYAGDADLGGELAAARWQSFRVRVAPFPGADV